MAGEPRNRIAILIPAYRAARSLSFFLPRVLDFVPRSDIIIIDDGSDDDTVQRCRAQGVTVISHAHNCGKGQALRTGFSAALARGYQAAITLDADGQHRPEYIPDFVKIFQSSPSPIIIGSRKKTFSQLPGDRYLSNRLTTVVVSLLAGVRIEDSQSGYRLYSAAAMQRVKTVCRRYQMESEFLIRAGRLGLAISHLPIVNDPSDTSHIRRGLDTLRFIAMALRLMWV